MRRTRAIAIAAASLGALGSLGALASAQIPAGTPSQATNDRTAAEAGFGSSGLWGDLPGGVAARPYISSLSLVNGGVTTPVILDGLPSSPAAQDGDVTAVVAPFNLCRADQPPQAGQCYPTPNRVGIALGYVDRGAVGTDFSRPEVPLRQVVTAETVIDMTIRLNTLGRTLRWSWLNGALESWAPSGLGRDDAEVRVRFRPVVTPAIDWSLVPGNGCTATPIRDCAIAQSQGETLSANIVLSLDDSLDPSLTGAVFATEGAVAGFLQPGGTPSAPVLDLQIASSHLTSSGALQRGALTALIPAQSLVNLYGVPSADAPGLFTARRTGDAGTQSAPVFRRATTARDGTDGLRVDISDITFSAPTYAVARRVRAPRTGTIRRGRTTTVTATAVAACRASACTASLAVIPSRLGRTTTPIAASRTSASGAVSIPVPSARLRAGSRYVLVLRRASGPTRRALVTSAVGTVR